MGETLGALPDEFYEHGTIDGSKADLLEKVMKITGLSRQLAGGVIFVNMGNPNRPGRIV